LSTIVYNGKSFAGLATAELVEPCGHALDVSSAEAPGTAGALILSSRIPPRVLRVKLFLDARVGADPASLAKARHRIAAMLLSENGAELVVPGEPEVTYRDAVCTGVSDWSDLGAAGSCEARFTCYDPIGYGTARSSTGTSFEVMGTWASWPTIQLTATQYPYLYVGCGNVHIRVAHAFSAGDKVIISCEAQTVTINGKDATGEVTLDSDFFALKPGTFTFYFNGCSAHTVSWQERWA
jgi:phage-related protein